MSKKLKLSLYFLIFFASSLPILFQFVSGGSDLRLSNTSAFSFDRGGFMEIAEYREAGKNDLLSRAFHNKGTTSAHIFSLNYLKHFNISYLGFSKTEPTLQISPYSPLFIILIPFYFIGLFYMSRKFRNPIFFVLLSLILIAPLPSAITEGAVHPKRYLAFMGTETILIVFAIYKLKLLRFRFLSLIIGIILCIEMGLFYNFFFTTYYKESNELFYWKGHIIAEISKEYWPKQGLIYTMEHLGEPHIYPLVGSSYPSSRYLEKRSYEYRDDWYYIKPFDNLFYAQTMDEIIAHISKDPTYSAIGLFNGEELSELPPSICYSLIKKKHSPLAGFYYFVIDIQPCSS